MSIPSEAPHSKDSPAEAMPLFPRWLSLDQYLRTIRSVVGDRASKLSPTIVLGNPSADLDSFVSAVIYSYFHNHSASQTKDAKATVYIPLLNLPKTPASALHRLRPEFDLAVRTAAAWRVGSVDHGSAGSLDASKILDQVITIHDLTTTFSSTALASYFTPTSTTPSQPTPLPVVLVDHNVPAIIGLNPDELSARLTVTGCIDHHVNESSGPQSYSPRIIDLNAGSCTSLVVSYLRSQNLFPDPSANPQPNSSELAGTIALQQLSSLALSSILIDTKNLKSTAKTKPVDREAVDFLTSHLTRPGAHGGSFVRPSASNTVELTSESTTTAAAATTFFAEDYHRILSDAKVNSVEKLNPEEILDRDYKQWSEPSSSSGGGTTKAAPFIEIGISSVPQPIAWLVDHAAAAASNRKSSSNGNTASDFVSAIAKFGQSYHLDIYLLLTRPTPRGKGLLAVAFTDRGLAILEQFEGRGAHALGLQAYVDDAGREEELGQALEAEFSGSGGNRPRSRVWWLTKLDNTRKQIAPLVRECAVSN